MCYNQVCSGSLQELSVSWCLQDDGLVVLRGEIAHPLKKHQVQEAPMLFALCSCRCVCVCVPTESSFILKIMTSVLHEAGACVSVQEWNTFNINVRILVH